MEFKITQYADDTTIILQGEQSIKSTFDCVQDLKWHRELKSTTRRVKEIGLVYTNSDQIIHLI